MAEKNIEQNDQEFTTDELAFAAHDKIDVLIDLLIEKRILTEEEFVKRLEKHYEN